MGGFTVLYVPDGEDRFEQLKDSLISALNQGSVEREKLRQLARVVFAWKAEVEVEIEQRVHENALEASRLDYILSHAQQQAARFDGIVLQECLREGNGLHAQLKDVAKSCGAGAARFADWLGLPGGAWQSSFGGVWAEWSGFIENVKVAPQHVADRLAQQLNDDAHEFFAAYSGILGNSHFQQIAISFPAYAKTVERNPALTVERVQELVERKAFELVGLLHSELGDNKPKAETANEDPNPLEGLLKPIQDLAAKFRGKLTRAQAERVLTDVMLNFLEQIVYPALTEAVALISTDVSHQIKTEYQQAFVAFRTRVAAKVEERRKSLLWPERRAEWRKLAAHWQKVIGDFIERFSTA